MCDCAEGGSAHWLNSYTRHDHDLGHGSAMKLRYLIIALLVGSAFAQQWSGILDPSRAVDWSATSPGVVGGIPSGSWTQCGARGDWKSTRLQSDHLVIS